MSSRNRKHSNSGKSRESSDSDEENDCENFVDEDINNGIIEILHNLCKLCKYIHKLYNIDEKKSQKWNRKNPILSTIDNYLDILDVASKQKDNDSKEDCADIIIDDLLLLYKDNRKNIINHSEDWLIKTSLLGEINSNNTKLHFNARALSKKKRSKRNIKKEAAIYLSIFYKQAVDLFEKHKNDKVPENSTNKYTALPYRFQRAYYLAFEQAINLDEKSKYIDDSIIIGEIIDTICTNLGIDDGTYVEDYTFTGLGGMFGNLANNFKVILDKFLVSAKNRGWDIPDDMGNIDSMINLFIGLVTEEDSLKNITGDIFDGLQSDDPMTYFNGFLDKLSNSEIIDKINETTGLEFKIDDMKGVLENDTVKNLLTTIVDSKREMTDLESEVLWES